MKDRVLITGGAGFIGSHTADILLNKGYRVRIMDNLSPKTHYGRWPDYIDKRIEKVKGDVRYKKHWQQALKNTDYVIHLAAWMDLTPDFSKFFEINVVGTANLYETIIKHELPIKKVVVASSQFVYGEGKWKCKKDGEVFPNGREEPDLKKSIWDPKCPICGDKISSLINDETHHDPPNAYAISKYTQELIALSMGELYSIPSVVLRYSVVHGPRQTLKNLYSGALRNFTLQILDNSNPVIFEDGEQLRDYVSVHDVAKANYIVLRSNKANFEIFNVGGEKGYSVIKLTKMIAHNLKKDVKITPTNMYRVGDIRHAVSDVSKLKKLGWIPKQTEEESVIEFINWVTLQNNSDKPKKNVGSTIKEMKNRGLLKKIKY